MWELRVEGRGKKARGGGGSSCARGGGGEMNVQCERRGGGRGRTSRGEGYLCVAPLCLFPEVGGTLARSGNVP